MRPKNSCYTYFHISGNFDPEKVTELLSLAPDRIRKIGDRLPSGKRTRCAIWEFGRCEEYDAEVENMMRKTVAPLLGKTDILNKIREENDVEFWLSIVPTVYPANPSPALAPPLDIIDFCHATRTEIDIDLYVSDRSEN